MDNIDIWFLNIIPDMLQSLMDKKMGVPKEIYDNYENIVHFAPFGGRKCVLGRPLCGA